MWPVATTVARAAPHILRLDFFQDRNEGTVSGKVGVKHRPAGVRGGVPAGVRRQELEAQEVPWAI